MHTLFFFQQTPTTELYTLSLHDALPICRPSILPFVRRRIAPRTRRGLRPPVLRGRRSEEHTSELQSHSDLVCRLLLEKKKKNTYELHLPIFVVILTAYTSDHVKLIRSLK